MDLTVNIDAGGTFTDGVFTHGETTETAKVPTTEHDLTVCFMECIERGAEKLDMSVDSLLGDSDVIRFSTTVGTNTVIEKTGPRIGLLVTAGHESQLYGDGEKRVTDEFVDPDMVVGVEETVDSDGTVQDRPDPEAVTSKVKRLQKNGARILAIALRNANANPSNEKRVKSIISEAYPRHYLGAIPTLGSHEVTARPNDYRRLNTVVLNAYIHRPMKSTMYTAEDKVRSREYDKPLFVGHANGGMAGVGKTIAIKTHNSGPAAGVLAVQALSRLYSTDMAAADMGGTSIDISYVEGGEATMDLQPTIGGLETSISAIETNNLGAGGGSIATVSDGEVSVGPESAGANPGPACYGRGGTQATVTDADLVKGVINPEYFLGGQFELSTEEAREAVSEAVADPLDISVPAAATLITNEVERTIADGVTEVSDDVQTVAAFGGAGGIHAIGFAERAGANRLIMTPYSAVFSALGESMMDSLHTYSEYLGSVTPPSVSNHLDSLASDAERDMAAEGFGAEEIQYAADLLVEDGREYGVRELSYTPGDRVSGIPDDIRGEACLRLHATAPLEKASFRDHELVGPDPSDARKGEREVYWDDEFVQTAIYERTALDPGNVVDGPAVIEAVDTTIAVPPGYSLRIDAYGNATIDL